MLEQNIYALACDPSFMIAIHEVKQYNGLIVQGDIYINWTYWMILRSTQYSNHKYVANTPKFQPRKYQYSATISVCRIFKMNIYK